MALGAFKVAVCAVATGMVGYLGMLFWIHAMDDDEKLMVATDGRAAIRRHPSLGFFTGLLAVSLFVAVIALATAVFAWVVGA
jgi:hypothetical protein